VKPWFRIGDGYAFYVGQLTDNALHWHAAFQVASGATMVDAAGVEHRDAALIVPPMVRHRMVAAAAARTFFIEPHCAFADRLRERCGDGITAAPELQDLGEDDVRPTAALPASGLDPRLLEAMSLLAGQTMPDLAAQVGLSPQRLRGLARSQLGMTLARLRLWRRLAAAAQALREDQSLAQAAITAGFADQAHFSRQMRQMMGVTPSTVLPVLRLSATRKVDGDRPAQR
jgi:AraC-like DNA-binding protein